MEDKLGDKVKKFELYKDQRVVPDVFFAIRLDGRKFSGFVKRMKFKQPFDDNFKEIMLSVAEGLTEEFKSIITYTHSDEISLIFDKNSNLFHRRTEKLISTTASYVSSKFLKKSGIKKEIVMFDSRIIVLPNEQSVVEYLLWRQLDAIRNGINSWAYLVLRKNGASDIKASKQLHGKKSKFKIELLSKHGINFDNIPSWQKRGHLLTWETYEKEGYDPIKKIRVLAKRRKIVINNEVPDGEKFKSLILRLLKNSEELEKTVKKV